MFSVNFIFINLIFYFSCESNYIFYQYCTLMCTNSLETYIKTVCPRARDNCRPNIQSCGQLFNPQFHDDYRQAVLDKHNEIRNKIAIGSKSNPPVANMNALNYNIDLDFLAQCTANDCLLFNEKCRHSMDESYGINMAVAYLKDKSFNVTDMLNMVESWYKDAAIVTGNFTYIQAENEIWYNTEMVKASTLYIGCGKMEYFLTDQYITLFVCNYGRHLIGYNKNVPILITGKAASACEDNKTANAKYPGLCGKINPLTKLEPQMRGEAIGSKAAKLKPFFINTNLIPIALYWFTSTKKSD